MRKFWFTQSWHEIIFWISLPQSSLSFTFFTLFVISHVGHNFDLIWVLLHLFYDFAYFYKLTLDEARFLLLSRNCWPPWAVNAESSLIERNTWWWRKPRMPIFIKICRWCMTMTSYWICQCFVTFYWFWWIYWHYWSLSSQHIKTRWFIWQLSFGSLRHDCFLHFAIASSRKGWHVLVPWVKWDERCVRRYHIVIMDCLIPCTNHFGFFCWLNW